MKLYKELLEFSKPHFDEFFKNIELFENQFTWNEYNERLYELMYLENDYDNFQTVKELKEQVPELTDLCRKCGQYFIPARNKSIPKYDVIMGKQHEDMLMKFIAEKTGAVVLRADLENRSMPDCKVLRKDGTVAFYFELKFHGAPFVTALYSTGRYCYEGSATLDYKKIERQLELTKDLDAPVYYVHWLEYPCLKGVFYESADDVKDYINEQHEVFERKKREGDSHKGKASRYYKKMYSPLLNMKDFNSFISMINEMVNE